jgi:hypothetical protein
MKNVIFRSTFLFTFSFLINSTEIFSQASVSSSAGYTVNIVIIPVTIIPSSTVCTWGYNYNVRVNYNISFTGTNIPASLYTLQGYITCGSTTHFFDLPNNGGTGTVTSTSNQWNSNSDCNTATVTSLHCNSVNIQINGNGIAAQTITFPVTSVTLPVQLLNFSATPQTHNVILRWATASETGNNNFTIERSANGIEWQQIKDIPGAGTSATPHQYDWFDEAPLRGISYYRLRQTDMDGHSSLSEVKSVRYTAGENNIAIYPTPNTGNTITITGLPDYNNHRLTLINSNGASIFTTPLSSFSVSLPALQAGAYIIRMENMQSGQTTNLRYIKL